MLIWWIGAISQNQGKGERNIQDWRKKYKNYKDDNIPKKRITWFDKQTSEISKCAVIIKSRGRKKRDRINKNRKYTGW